MALIYCILICVDVNSNHTILRHFCFTAPSFLITKFHLLLAEAIENARDLGSFPSLDTFTKQ